MLVQWYNTVYILTVVSAVTGQQAPYNYGQNRDGEQQGDLSPTAIAGISSVVILVVFALLITMFFCYYVRHQRKQKESFLSKFRSSRNEDLFETVTTRT